MELLPTPAPSQASLPEQSKALTGMIQGGINVEAATLLQIEGLGISFARVLQGRGISDIEALSNTDPSDLLQIDGIGEKRSQSWVEQANHQVSQGVNAFRYCDRFAAGIVVEVAPVWVPDRTDLYRFGQARRYRVFSGSDSWQVEGAWSTHYVGQSPEGLVCDCEEGKEESDCSHVLAVLLHRKNSDLVALDKSLDQTDEGKLNLLKLWLEG